MKQPLLALLLTAGCLQARAHDPFSEDDLKRQVAYTALHLADWSQTQDIRNHPGLYETNVLLGRHPSEAKVRNYFVATLAAHWAISYALPTGWRPYWQGSTIALEAIVVRHNTTLGLRIGF